jgi:hypothetical protein
MREMNYREGMCPVAEDLMPRLIITGTLGAREKHQENAEKLRDVIDQFK